MPDFSLNQSISQVIPNIFYFLKRQFGRQMGSIKPFIIIKSIDFLYTFFLSGSYQHFYQRTELFSKYVVLHSMVTEVGIIMCRVKTKMRNFLQEVI